MFKRMQWKIVLIFVALVLAIMFTVGIYMIQSIVRLTNTTFVTQLDKVMSGEFTRAVKEALRDDSSVEEQTLRVNNVISAYSGQLSLSDQRQCAILNAADGSKIAASGVFKNSIEKTPNIIKAMSGQTGKQTQFMSPYMDYAYYINMGEGSGAYIIYVKDNKQSMNAMLHNLVYIIIQALLFGVLASIFLGYFLSKTITNPISVLTEKAEDFAEGNFDSNLEASSEDEIGTLVETFNYMGGVMKRAISETAAEKHKLEVIIEQVNSGIIAFNTNQQIISINSAAKAMLGIDENKIDEIRFDKIFSELNLNVCMAEFMYLEKSRAKMLEIEAGGKHLKAYFVPFKIENDKTAGVVCAFEDVTEQFNLEESRRKFVAEVSHELKTPLTTIGAYTETLIDNHPVESDTTLSFLKTIQNETVKMTTLVKNLLTLSKFDARSIEMKREYFSLDTLVRDIVSTFGVEAENKGLKLKYNTVNEIPLIYADKFQIERAIKNIISNSIKYTPENGEIKVFVGCMNSEVYIKIEDNGIGIPESDLAHIFERFYRVDKARSRDQGGTGLGLSIAKEIIQQHKGTISMESKVGEYTKVTIKLPIAKSGVTIG